MALGVAMGFFGERQQYPAGPAGGQLIGAAPPDNQVPCVTPVVPATLAYTEDTSVAITHIAVYRGGLAFTLALRLRALGFDESGDGLSCVLPSRSCGGSEVEPSPEALKFGVQFADGRTATNVDEFPPSEERVTVGAVLLTCHQGGGRGRYYVDDWLQPLPPPGPLVFVCEWPARSIAETALAVDAEVLREAASQSVVLWPDPDDAPQRGL